MTRATAVTDGTTATAAQYNSLQNDYLIREQAQASYSVYKVDSTYYADHCLGTGIDYSDTSFSVLMQSVIDYLSGLGGKISLKGDTTYETGGTQILLDGNDSDIQIFGEGKSTQLIDSTGGGGIDTSIFKIDGSSTAVNNIRISNLALESTATPKTDTHGIIARYCYHSMFDHLWIKNQDEEGIALIRECDYNLVTNNHFSDLGAAGVDCNVGSDYNVISNNTFKTCCTIDLGGTGAITIWEGAANITACLYNTVTGNTIYDSKGVGINMSGANYTTITGNTIYSPVIGIKIYAGTYNKQNIINGNLIQDASSTSLTTEVDDQVISNNTIIGLAAKTQVGLYLNSVDECAVTGNRISSGSYGISVNAGERNSLTGNVITDCSTHGIYLLAASIENIISACQCSGNTDDGIHIADSNYNAIVGCICTNNGDLGVSESGTSDFTLLDGCMLNGNTDANEHDVNAANSVVGDVIT